MENVICGIKKKANIRWLGDSDFSAAEFPHFFIKRRHSRLIVCIWGLSILDGNYLSLNRIILVSPSVHGYFRSFLVILQWVNMCQYVNMWQYWSSVIAWRWWRRGWDFSTTLEVESSPSFQERLVQISDGTFAHLNSLKRNCLSASGTPQLSSDTTRFSSSHILTKQMRFFPHDEDFNLQDALLQLDDTEPVRGRSGLCWNLSILLKTGNPVIYN